jgi:hypothetical protein
MAEIRNVKLELLRPGPAHNQLLSPLTPYLALCGAEGPVTVHMPFEHRQLLNRLERLRYVSGGKEISQQQREAEVREIGEALGKVLAQVPSLVSELANARGSGSSLVHLRLAVSASELGMVPFEFAIGGDGFPASGSPLFLQSHAPITLTREVRRGRPLPVNWDKPPKILFAFANPGGLPAVPAQDHLGALRRAIDPWINWQPTAEGRLPEVKRMLTVLPDATLERIRTACATSEYTHVHILAHGAEVDVAGDSRYGVALCSESGNEQPDIVDGERLAIALTATDPGGSTRHRPTVVTLATCDSGNVASVLTPGGSIAHALHAGGMPWVIASQFPLWMRASSIAAELLYAGLLEGDDPRWVLYELRQRLRTDSSGTHDWASIVAYSTAGWEFQQQVEAFRNRQQRQKIEIKFDKAEKLGRTAREAKKSNPSARPPEFDELDRLYESIREDLTDWRNALPATAPGRERARRLAMSAASEKRIGNLFRVDQQEEKAHRSYHLACELYKRACEADPLNHWPITQYLSMMAVLAPADGIEALAREYGPWWNAVRQIALWESIYGDRERRTSALSTLAELELLGSIYGRWMYSRAEAQAAIEQWCRTLREAAGADAFVVFATRRQFRRYYEFWPREEWNQLAMAGETALGNGENWVGKVTDS